MEQTNSALPLVTHAIISRSHEDLMIREKEFNLTPQALSVIHDLLLTSANGSKVDPITIDESTSSEPVIVSDFWTRCGTVSLGKKQK